MLKNLHFDFASMSREPAKGTGIHTRFAVRDSATAGRKTLIRGSRPGSGNRAF
jgi:hypothetical protein